MLFSSTICTYGFARGIVVHTGMDTAIGTIQKEVELAAEDEEETPLKKKLNQFGEQLTYAIGIICLVVWIINFNNFSDPIHGGWIRGCIYYFKIAVALAVAAIPEGLPAVITTCLALGTKQMAKNNAIVRTLPSVETLGCTTVICSDKTGTLTLNKMTAVTFTYFEDVNSPVEVNIKEKSIDKLNTAHKDILHQFASVCILNNNSQSVVDNDGYRRVGAPTEISMKVLAEQIGGQLNKLSDDPEAFEKSISHNKEGILEFSSERKMMSTVISGCEYFKESKNTILIKGASERVLEACDTIRLANGKTVPLSNADKEKIKAKLEKMASNALRVIGVAVNYNGGLLKDLNAGNQRALLGQIDQYSKYEKEGTFLGFVGIMDPLRPEVTPAIVRCKTAGIRVIMITGDAKITANRIATDCGILDGGHSEGRSFTGQEFEKMTYEEKKKYLDNDRGMVFSRVEPRHKREIVKVLSDLVSMLDSIGKYCCNDWRWC